MTERFKVDNGLENVLCWEIIDKEIPDATCGEICTLLNTLNKKECENPLFTKKTLHHNNQKLTEENHQLKKHIHKLIDENEHVKQTIKEAYANERTEIGKYVLKQLLEAIQ